MPEVYIPHNYADCPVLSLPPIKVPEPTKKSQSFKQWIVGPSSSPIDLADFDVVEAYRERWALKWEHYCKTVPKAVETVEHTRESIAQRADWLRQDLERIQGSIWDIPTDGPTMAPPEVLAGISLVNSLVEEHRYDFNSLSAISTEHDADGEFHRAQDMLSMIETVHAFAMQCSSEFKTLRWQSLIKANNSAADIQNDQADDISSNSRAPSIQDPLEPMQEFGRQHSREASAAEDVEKGFRSMDSTQPSSTSNSIRTPHRSQRNRSRTGVGHSEDAEGNLTTRLTPQLVAKLNDMSDIRGLSPNRRPGAGDAETHQASSGTAHKANFTILIAMGFFGASITWSTLFSGARGDLSIIAWAASVFLVCASAAASGGVLVDADDAILEKYSTVRWTARIFMIVSATHAFVGVLLLSLGIMFLNPNATGPAPQMRGSGPFPCWERAGVIAAGGYGLLVPTICVAIAVTVRRRYSRRTWRF